MKPRSVDYPTIRAAIDAAEEGNEIRVAAGVCEVPVQVRCAENLSITKGVTLTGGWDDDFSTRQPGDSTIDGQGLGRGDRGRRYPRYAPAIVRRPDLCYSCGASWCIQRTR